MMTKRLRIARLVLAEIVIAPRDIDVYLERVVFKRLHAVDSAIEDVLDALGIVEKDQDLYEDANYKVTDNQRYDLEDVEHTLNALLKVLQDQYGDSLVKSIWDSSWSSHMKMTQLSRVLEALERISKGNFDYYSSLGGNLTNLEDILAPKISEDVLGYLDEAGYDIRALINLQHAQQRLWSAYEEMTRVFGEAVSRVKQLVKEQQRRSDPEARPKTEDVETLYHASAYASQLVKTGFSDKYVREEAKGLGGGPDIDLASKQPLISATSDFKIAQDIMRTLREASMVARGEVSEQDILDWARREGVPDLAEKVTSVRKKDSDPAAWRLELYNAYLWFNKSRRTNPVFGNSPRYRVDFFKSVNPRDVGILEIKVDMTDSAIDYVPGEREFRVPARSILEVKRKV